jgi:hypothetical protein
VKIEVKREGWGMAEDTSRGGVENVFGGDALHIEDLAADCEIDVGRWVRQWGRG